MARKNDRDAINAAHGEKFADADVTTILGATRPLWLEARIALGEDAWPHGDGAWEVRVDADGVAWTMWDEVPF